jgi:hypothetical protein
VKYPFLVIIFFLQTLNAVGQSTIEGHVLDFDTNLPLPFVNVTLPHSEIGMSTDSTGKFHLSYNPVFHSYINFSLIGYKSRKFELKTLDNHLTILLKTSVTDLEGVVVKPGENPAWEIIRRVQKHEHANNPLKFEAFQADNYSKIKMLLESQNKDSLKQKTLNLFIVENTGKLYVKKGQKKELIEHTVSNIPKMIPMNIFVNNNINPFSFYEPFIRISLNNYQFSNGINGGGERNYVNPIKSGSFSIYDFELTDTLINKKDSLFVIHFNPYKGKSVDALIGVMHIHAVDYAIAYVKVKQADGFQSSNLTIEQNYTYENQKWYPKERSLAFEMPVIFKGDSAIFKTVLLDEAKNFQPSITDQVYFDGVTHLTLETADTIKLEDFHDFREMELDSQETVLYQKWNFEEKRPQYQKFLDFLIIPSKALLQSSFAVGPAVLLFDQNLMNYHERIRVGIGFQNKLHENPRIGIRASIGYGLVDNLFKHRASFAYHITKDRYNRISFFTRSDIDPPGRIETLGANYSVPSPETHYFNSKGYNVNKYNKYGAALFFRPLKWTWFRLYAENETIKGINYQLFENETHPTTNYRNYGFMFRYARRETFIRTGLFERTVNQSFPIIQAKSKVGINRMDNSQLFEMDISITQQLRWKKLGSTLVFLSGGYVKGEVPFNYLFHNQYNGGILSTSSDGFLTGSFTGIAYNQFASVRFIHNFGKNIFRLKTNWSQPEIALGYNVTWSLLHENKELAFLNLKDFSTGNYEASIYLSNLLRIRIMGLYTGFGVRLAYNHSREFLGPSRLAARPLVRLPIF